VTSGVEKIPIGNLAMDNKLVCNIQYFILYG